MAIISGSRRPARIPKIMPRASRKRDGGVRFRTVAMKSFNARKSCPPQQTKAMLLSFSALGGASSGTGGAPVLPIYSLAKEAGTFVNGALFVEAEFFKMRFHGGGLGFANDVRVKFENDFLHAVQLRSRENHCFGAFDVHDDGGRFPFGDHFVERIGGNFMRMRVIAVMQAGGNNIVVDVKGDFAFGAGDGFEKNLWGEAIQTLVNLTGRLHSRIGFVCEDVFRTANARAKQTDKTDAATDFKNAVALGQKFADEHRLGLFVGALENFVANAAADVRRVRGNDDAVQTHRCHIEQSAQTFSGVAKKCDHERLGLRVSFRAIAECSIVLLRQGVQWFYVRWLHSIRCSRTSDNSC